MGSRPPNHPQLSDFLYGDPALKKKPVKGITVYGLAAQNPAWYPPATPPWRIWRDLGSGGAELSSEFTITDTIGATAMLYAALYALEPLASPIPRAEVE